MMRLIGVMTVGMLLVVGEGAPLSPGGTVATAAPADPTLAPIQDDPKLPRVLLIGDSISIGYTLPVRAMLQGKANVHRIPENGGPTIRGKQQIEAWLGTGRWDVIHFNWGLHDLKGMPDGKIQVPLEAYEQNMRQLVERLKKTGATLIWGSTTPVPEGADNPPRKNSDVLAYNAVAKKIMEANGVLTNDLYTAILLDLATLQRPANVHFQPAGYEALAKKVAASIEAALQRPAPAKP